MPLGRHRARSSSLARAADPSWAAPHSPVLRAAQTGEGFVTLPVTFTAAGWSYLRTPTNGNEVLRANLLFLHVVSVLTIFAALGVEMLALAHLHRATGGAPARAALAGLGVARRIGGPAMLLLVASGFWLATAFWHWQGVWIRLGLIGIFLVGAVGALMTGRPVRRLRLQVDQPGFETSLRDADPALRRSFVIRTVLLVAVVYLMTVKPS